MIHIRMCGIILVVAVVVGGCWGTNPNEVVVYTALDRRFSEPIFEKFTRDTGIDVLATYDVESQKTVGLANRILAERDRPRCDVFWNNEILNTLRLQREGLIENYVSPHATKFLQAFQSSEGAWHGFASRARVLLINTNHLVSEEYPQSILDLVDSRWRGKVGVAKPLFGTTATHAACLFAIWGEERGKSFFRNLRNNATIKAGNKQVALAVSSGELTFGLTDTDDAMIELERGAPVDIVYPDQDEGELGTLFIPNTVSIIQGCAHPDSARRLVDYLLHEEVEIRLAKGPSAQIPLNTTIDVKLRVQTPSQVCSMQVDFAAAADHWEPAAQFLRDLFIAD